MDTNHLIRRKPITLCEYMIQSHTTELINLIHTLFKQLGTSAYFNLKVEMNSSISSFRVTHFSSEHILFLYKDD